MGHFHLQITASGLGARGANSEAELFKKIRTSTHTRRIETPTIRTS